MTKYELLKACRSVCDALTRNGINATDTKYIEGQKVTWVVYYLSQQYEVGEATVYRMAKRLSENCEI